MNLDEALGRFIRLKRVELEIQQKELAKAVGVSPTTMLYYEKGSRCMNASVFLKICELLNVSPDEAAAYALNNSNERL